MGSFIMVGTGKVGLAMGRALRQIGWKQIAVISRSKQRATEIARQENIANGGIDATEFFDQAKWIFLAVPDGKINFTCKKLAESDKISSNNIFVHFSGALSSDQLLPAKHRGARTLSAHPLQSFANENISIQSLKGTLFSLEGEQEALEEAKAMVEQLEGIPFTISKEQKVVYHAGAVVASNYVVTLADLAVNMLAQVGIPQEYGLKGLLALMSGVVNNIGNVGTVDALTGPISRGDITTVEAHIRELEVRKQWQELYKKLGVYTADIALKKGTINSSQGVALKKVLE